jgi:hypothetical protein
MKPTVKLIHISYSWSETWRSLITFAIMLENVLKERPSKPGGTECKEMYQLLVYADGNNLMGKNT